MPKIDELEKLLVPEYGRVMRRTCIEGYYYITIVMHEFTPDLVAEVRVLITKYFPQTIGNIDEFKHPVERIYEASNTVLLDGKTFCIYRPK